MGSVGEHQVDRVRLQLRQTIAHGARPHDQLDICAPDQRAEELGMERTHYAETTGLDAGNVSTARDQARVLEAAYSDPLIASLLRTESHSFRCGKRTETLNNTNRLLRSRTDVCERSQYLALGTI